MTQIVEIEFTKSGEFISALENPRISIFFQIKFAQCDDCIQLCYPESLNENPNKSNSKCNAPWDRRMQPQFWE